jgi:hypothetical protein
MDPEASECLVIMVAARVNRTDETPVSEGQPISGGERDSGSDPAGRSPDGERLRWDSE